MLNTLVRARALDSFQLSRCVLCVYGDLQLAFLEVVWSYKFFALLNDLRPRLCSRPKECRCTTQRDMRPVCAAVPVPSSQVRYRSSPAATTGRHVSWESVEPINVANLRVNQRSQINEDTVEPSLAAQVINPLDSMPYALGLISHRAPDSYHGY